MSENEIIKIYTKGISSVVNLVKDLSEKIDSLNGKIDNLTEENSKLKERVQSLENQTKTNSNNSSKPPSSDGLKKKTKSLRKPTGKKPGGQPGHKGFTLEQVDSPDEIIEHTVDKCKICAASLKDVAIERYIIRQVIDLPDVKVKITEHRAEVKKCTCGHINKAEFPEGITQPVQYGTKIKATSVYLNQYQFVPYDRQEEFFEDIFSYHVSKGTLASINESCYHSLESVENNIKEILKNDEGAVHYDETGVHVNKKLEWLHVTSNDQYTYYQVHNKRGSEAIDSIGILPKFKGTAVHDSWRSYNKYTNCKHSLCCAHILRELNGITELEKQSWAKNMKELLLDIKSEVDKAFGNANALTLDKIIKYEEQYDSIIKFGQDEDFKLNFDSKTCKRSNSKSKSLLERLSLHKDEVLRFMNDFDIPFDNNQAERDIRMTKVKLKVSGTFRSSSGAKFFARIRGYISTVRKQSRNVLECLESTFIGKLIDPTVA
jgi:transposase